VAPATSGPILVTTNDVTIDGVTISSSGSTGYGIHALGTAANPVRNLTIRNCTIKGFNVSIWAEHVTNLKIDNCLIQDADYAGILVFSGVGGTISNNTIQRIGAARTNLTIAGKENNAYGIALSRTATSDFVANPRSSNFLVTGNLVEDVPLWHCYDTHAGDTITFSNNVSRRCPRAYFITLDGLGTQPKNVTLTGNRIEQARQVSGGTNSDAVTLVNLQGGTVTNNLVSTTYPTPWVYDYLGLNAAGSSNVTVSGQVAIQ
jgi:parallel beta-helix repeat protein